MPVPARAAPPPPPTPHARRPPEPPRPGGVPPGFGDQRTRQVDPGALSAARQHAPPESFDEEATRINATPMFPDNAADPTILGAAVDPRAWAFEDSGRHVAARELSGFEDHREEATTLGTMDHFDPQRRQGERASAGSPDPRTQRTPNVDWDLE